MPSPKITAAAKKFAAVAMNLANGSDSLELTTDTVYTTGARLGRVLPINADGAVDMTTQELREVYATLCRMVMADADMKEMARRNAGDEMRREGARRADLDGDTRSVAHVKGLACAYAQCLQREQDFQAALEAWEESVAEAGSAHVVSGGNPQDARAVAYHAVGPKPVRWWRTAA